MSGVCHSKVLQLHSRGAVLRLVGGEHDCLHGLRGLQGGGSQLCHLPQLGRCCFCIVKLLQHRNHMALSRKNVILALHARKSLQLVPQQWMHAKWYDSHNR